MLLGRGLLHPTSPFDAASVRSDQTLHSINFIRYLLTYTIVKQAGFSARGPLLTPVFFCVICRWAICHCSISLSALFSRVTRRQPSVILRCAITLFDLQLSSHIRYHRRFRQLLGVDSSTSFQCPDPFYSLLHPSAAQRSFQPHGRFYGLSAWASILSMSSFLFLRHAAPCVSA